MSFKYFGLLAVFVLFCGAGFIVWRWRDGTHVSLSQRVAVNKYRTLFYILLFSVVLGLLLPFFLYWFIPAFHVSVWFGVFIAISAIAQYLCTLIPEVGGWKTKYHRFLAGLSAVCLIPALFILFTTDAASLIGRLIALVSLVVMTAIVVMLLRAKGTHSHFLILQFVYFGAFFVPILLLPMFFSAAAIASLQ